YRVAAPVRRDELCERRLVVVGERRPAVVDDERRLVERELLDRETVGSCAERKVAAGGHPKDGRGAPGRDQRTEVLDLPLDSVGRRVAAVAAAATVVVVDGKRVGKQLRELRRARIEGAMLEGTSHQHERRPPAGAVEGDGGAIR